MLERKLTVYVLVAYENSECRCGVTEVKTFASEQTAAAEMRKQYEKTLKLLGNDVDQGDSAPAIFENCATIMANGDYDHFAWMIYTQEVDLPQEDLPQELQVKTPLGTLIAKDAQNSDYPGIHIDLKCDYGDDKDTQIAIVSAEYGEKLQGKREISIITFEDMASEEYTRYLQVDSHDMIRSE